MFTGGAGTDWTAGLRMKPLTNLHFPFYLYLVLQHRGAVRNTLSGDLEGELNVRVTVCLWSESPSHPSVMQSVLLFFAQEVKIQLGRPRSALAYRDRQLKSSNPV